MIDKNKVISIVKEKGPVLPMEIVREVGGDTFFVGAVLSQLVDEKIIRISHTKIGGSPVYYYPGQESKLQELYDKLNEKEKKAYDIIKKHKIIRDKVSEPALRVALRNIKDFAKALEVNINGNKEIFWKWYLFSNEEASNKIKEIVAKELSKKKIEPLSNEPEKEKQEIRKEDTKEETKEQEKREIQKTIEEDKAEEEKQEKKEEKPDSPLLEKIQNIFNEKNIDIIETDIIRKTSDIELIVKIPSPVGKLTYFCKVKTKKKSNDKDLSSLYVESQMRKLPVLYVITGELTKKAKEKLDKEFKIIKILKI